MMLTASWLTNPAEKTAKTSPSWLAVLSWFKLEVAGFSWSLSLSRKWSAKISQSVVFYIQ